MKGDKINTQNLDKLYGGIIQDGTNSITPQGNDFNVVSDVYTGIITADDARNELLALGYNDESITKLFSLTRDENTTYNFEQIKEQTGIDFNHLGPQ